MTEIEIVLTILNHPLTWIGIIAIPTTIIFKHWFKSKLEVFKFKNTNEKNKKYKLESMSGKIAFAIANTDIAYKKVMDDIKDHKNNLAKATDENTKKIFEGKIKSSEQQLRIIQKILEHKDVVDMISPLAIPAMEKVEKKIMGFVKSGLNF